MTEILLEKKCLRLLPIYSLPEHNPASGGSIGQAPMGAAAVHLVQCQIAEGAVSVNLVSSHSSSKTRMVLSPNPAAKKRPSSDMATEIGPD